MKEAAKDSGIDEIVVETYDEKTTNRSMYSLVLDSQVDRAGMLDKSMPVTEQESLSDWHNYGLSGERNYWENQFRVI